MAETGSVSIYKAAIHPRAGIAIVGSRGMLLFGSGSLLKSGRGRQEAIRDPAHQVCTLRGRRTDCRAVVKRCTLERCDH